MTWTDKVYLGPAPAEEECVQLGSDDYDRRARKECREYIAAIIAVCGEPPEGARLKVEAQAHDFGSYYEVVCQYDGNDPAAATYAATCDERAPQRWPRNRQAAESRVRFQAGTVVTTLGATLVATAEQMNALVQRHQSGDWGDVTAEDAKANERALKWGDRILSSYKLSGETLWVLTEADRSATTVLTPGEY